MYFATFSHSFIDTLAAFAIFRALFRGIFSGETCVVNVVT
jgi:hypothetical protein